MTNTSAFTPLLEGGLWGTPLLLIFIGLGVWFSIQSRFLQIRYLKDIRLLLTQRTTDEAGLSSLQAFLIALGGRVGPGNVTGIAIAISLGGPGALFWMWVIAFVGASCGFVEATLGRLYREKVDGIYRGGPAYYIEQGFGKKWRWYGMLFAVAAILSCGVFSPASLSYTAATALHRAWHLPPWLSGIAMTMVAGWILFGGVKRLGLFSQRVVPVMVLGYLALALVVVLLEIKHVPNMIALVVKSAFGKQAALAGITGQAIAWGMRNGLFANEVGRGTGPHAAACANTAHPVQQGLVEVLSVFVVSMGVCTATGVMILLTHQYNVMDSQMRVIVAHAPHLAANPDFLQSAMNTALPGLGPPLLALILLLFAFTTIVSFLYYAETNFIYLLRNQSHPIALRWMRLMMLSVIFIGSMGIWQLGTCVNIGSGLMCWLNVIPMIGLAPVAMRALRNYEMQVSEDFSPCFSAATPEKTKTSS